MLGYTCLAQLGAFLASFNAGQATFEACFVRNITSLKAAFTFFNAFFGRYHTILNFFAMLWIGTFFKIRTAFLDVVLAGLDAFI